MENRRQHPRKSVVKSATVFYKNGTCSMSCIVMDQSEDGAKIKVNAHEYFECPPTVQLKYANVAKVHSCRLVWSNDDVFGVEYIA